MSFRAVLAVAASIALQTAVTAQAPNGGTAAPKTIRQRAALESLAQPPVPNDPLELVLAMHNRFRMPSNGRRPCTC
jgi:hypothetical protein